MLRCWRERALWSPIRVERARLHEESSQKTSSLQTLRLPAPHVAATRLMLMVVMMLMCWMMIFIMCMIQHDDEYGAIGGVVLMLWSCC